MKYKRSYCKVYLKRKQKVILLSKFKKKKKSKGSCCKCFKDRDMIPTQHLHSTLAWSGMGPHGSYPMWVCCVRSIFLKDIEEYYDSLKSS
jgi:hypothetical protein